jgi:HlyD family secretion protein
MPSGLCSLREDVVKRLLLFLVLIGVAVTAAAYWYNPTSRSTGEEGYTLMPVEYGTLKESISATGQLQPREVIAVASQLPGEVIKIYAEADENRVVKKGQPLLQLDDRLAKQKLQTAKDAVQVAKSGVAQAESALKAAQAAYDYSKGLWNKDVLPNEKRVQVKYQLDAAKDTVAAAKLKVDAFENEQRGAQLGVDLLTIQAPVAGRIIQRNVRKGQMAGPTSPTPLFLIASDMGRMQVNALVAEGDIGKMRVGLTATFTLYAYSENNEEFSGKVESIRDMPMPAASSALGSAGAIFYPVIIDAVNRKNPASPNDWMLKPGMTATVEIHRRQHDSVWSVPTSAVGFQLDEYFQTPQAKQELLRWQKRADKDDWKYVWVFREKKPWPLFVRTGGKNAAGETGINDGQRTEVLEWEPELDPKPSPNVAASVPQVIIAAPPAHKPGLLEGNKLKLS